MPSSFGRFRTHLPAGWSRSKRPGGKRDIGAVPAKDYLRWRDRGDLFEKMAAQRRDDVIVTGIGEPDQVIAQRTTGGLFSLLGVHAQLGRTLMDSDDELHAPNTAVLSDRLWRRIFHADPRVIGRAITVSDEVCTIVGVMPPEFEFTQSNIEMWMPLRLTPVILAC